MNELEKILARGASITLDLADEPTSAPASGLVGPDGRPIASAAAVEEEPDLEEPPCPKCGEVGLRQVIEALGGHWRELCHCGHEFRRGRGVAPTGGV